MPAGNRKRIFSRVATVFALTGVVTTAAVLTTTPAHAETSDISATGKGITGGALLGGEAVMSVEAALSVRSPWAYVLGGVVGAGAGGYGGYYMEQNADAHYSYYMLAGGMALAIPATLAIIQATSYHYEDTTTAPDAAPVDMKPTASVTSASLKRSHRKPRLMPSLVGVQQGDLQLGVPAVAVIPTYTQVEMKKFGVAQQTELRVPVFSAIF